MNLYDSLVFPTASGMIVPDLATSWNVSANSMTYTFTLRSGVTFHNGDQLTAQDVVFSMDRLLNLSQGYSYLFTPYIANVSAPSSNTVVINLKTTFGPFLSALVRLYVLDHTQVIAHEDHASSTYGSNGDYGSTWLLTHDAGSGPYEMVSANLEAEHDPPGIFQLLERNSINPAKRSTDDWHERIKYGSGSFQQSRYPNH